MRVQVVYASRHGWTAGIAERIAEILRSEGADVVVADAADRPDPSGFDAYVIGSGVQIGSWHKGGDRVSRAEPKGSQPGRSGCSAVDRYWALRR